MSAAKSSADAKSFLIRTLGPVTNIFKSKSQSSSLQQQQKQPQDTGYNDENNSTSISESLERDTESVFLATTCETNSENDNDDPNCNGNRMYLLDGNNDGGRQLNQSTDFGTIATHKLRHIDSGDLSSWWCTNDENEDDENNDDDDETVANDVTLNQSDLSENSGTTNLVYRIRHVESGEKAWWMTTDNSSKENSVTKNVILREPSVAKSENREWWLDTDSKSSASSEQSKQKCVGPPPPPPPVYRIRHIESGEKAWWMNGDSSEQENKSKMSSKSNSSISEKKQQWYAQSPAKDTVSSETGKPITSKYRIRHVESGEKAWWMQDDKSNDTELNNGTNCSVTAGNQNDRQITEIDEPPLGDRASPEGLEDTANKGRTSPSYDSKDRVKNLKKLFISRHTNIDDLLGGSSHPLSPLLLDCFESDEPFEKITPDQVRIHEGTVGPLDKERLHANR